jgi:hypothetical protein
VNFTVHTCDQKSPEWFALRAGRVTASRAKDMLATIKSGEAAARRDLRLQLACERIVGQPQEDAYTNADMERGVTLEPVARAAYEAHTGTLVDQVGFLAHTELMAGGSPDGVIGDYAGLLELKAPRPANHLRYWREGGMPKEHEAQALHLLWLTGAEWLDLVSYCPLFPERLQLYTHRVHAKDLDLAGYEKKVRAFLAEVDAEVLAVQGWGVVAEVA